MSAASAAEWPIIMLKIRLENSYGGSERRIFEGSMVPDVGFCCERTASRNARRSIADCSLLTRGEKFGLVSSGSPPFIPPIVRAAHPYAVQ